MNEQEKIVESMIEVKLPTKDDFLRVKETLTRMGVASSTKKEIYQSCHILHKAGRYFIVHFKEMFMLDGKPTDFSEEDRTRRNTIANKLAEWNLVELVDPDRSASPVFSDKDIKHKLLWISYADKKNWSLISKYSIGKPIRHTTEKTA